jgi:DNA topoisomerase IB
VIALSALLDLDDDLTPPQRKRAVNEAVEKASEALGNTKAVCRGSYIHPGILAAAETGELTPLLETARSVANEKPTPELVAGERLLAALLPLLSGTDRRQRRLELRASGGAEHIG